MDVVVDKKLDLVLDKKGEKGNGNGGNSDCIVNLSTSTEPSNFEVTSLS